MLFSLLRYYYYYCFPFGTRYSYGFQLTDDAR